MEKLYLAFVDTPGLFAALIRKTIDISYVHVVLSLDAGLSEAYSIGRRNPFIPFFAGFEKEDTYRIEQAFPTARYRIVALDCTKEQKEKIEHHLKEYFKKRFRYHYCILGLPFLLLDVPFYQKRHYTCSSFIAKILERNGVELFGKHFSLVTPRDFYELEETKLIYEGPLSLFNRQKCHIQMPSDIHTEAAYES